MLYTCNHFRVLKGMIQSGTKKLDLYASATVAHLLSAGFKSNRRSNQKLVLILTLTLISQIHTHNQSHSNWHSQMFWVRYKHCVFLRIRQFWIKFTQPPAELFCSPHTTKTLWVYMNMWPRFCSDESIYRQVYRNLFWVMSDSLFCLFCICLFFLTLWKHQQSVQLFFNNKDECYIRLIYITLPSIFRCVNTHLYSCRTRSKIKFFLCVF